MKTKIALIIPYFGQWPEYFELYLYSCSKNSFIDFLFFTDCEMPPKVYPNTHFTLMSFSDYCKKASEILNIDFRPDRPYKLCDLKPFYGIIHKNDLKEYEWWGYGDIDLVYGNLSLLVNEERLNRYDIISSHSYKVSGHFTIIRKDSKYSSCALHIKGWKRILEDKNNHCFDEIAFSKKIAPLIAYLLNLYYKTVRLFHPAKDKTFYLFNQIQKIYRLIHPTLFMLDTYSTYPPEKGEVVIYNPESGKVTIAGENKYFLLDPACMGSGNEIPYIHFLFFKQDPYKLGNSWKEGYYQIQYNYHFQKGDIVCISTDKINVENHRK